MTTDDLIRRLEKHYDFECGGGPLRDCVEWQELTRRAHSNERIGFDLFLAVETLKRDIRNYLLARTAEHLLSQWAARLAAHWTTDRST